MYSGAGKDMTVRTSMTCGLLLLATSMGAAQVLIPDFRVNRAADNLKGLWRTSVAAMPDGKFAVAWQDFNDYDIPVTEQPRIAVQMFSANASAFGALNLFRGESRSLSIWTSDFLEGNPDIAYMPDGTLLVAVEHEGRLSIGVDDVGSSEVGFGAISSGGEIIDISNGNGVILWNATTRVDWQEHPRIAVDPAGNILLVANGPTFDTRRHSIEMQVFDANGNYAGNPIIPHAADAGPDFNHYFADVATNGEVLVVCWQDGRQEVNFDITAQFYDINGPTGQNLKVNAGDLAGILNIWPSVAMNSSGASVVVWGDARITSAGDVYGQRFNAAGAPVGDNFRISNGRGEIMDRPEVAMLNNGNFMVVWTDSSAVFGDDAFRAMGRQFTADAQPIDEPFVIPGVEVPSGLVNIASDGNAYYCAWLDGRDQSAYWNVYAKKFGPAVTGVESAAAAMPRNFELADAYPNPFNPETTIAFSIAQTSHVEISVFNTVGERVAILAEAPFEAGDHEVIFSARHLPSGVYIYRIQAGGFSDSKKVLLLK